MKVFGRFVKQIAPVGAAAKLEAVRLGASQVRSEHVLLGVLRADAGVGAAALTASGVSLDQARDKVVERTQQALQAVGVGATTPGMPEDREVAAELLFDSVAYRLLEEAVKISLLRGEKPVTDAHLVLALCEQRTGGAVTLLNDLGVTAEQVKQHLR